jgi:hypothetical protein
MRNQAPESAPKLWRAVAVQLAVLAVVAVASELPWVKKAHAEPVQIPKVVEPPKPAERRLRVIHLPPPEKPPEPQKVAKAEKPPEPVAKAAPKPPEAKPPEPVAKAEPPPPKPAKPQATKPPPPPQKVAQAEEPKPEPVAEAKPEPRLKPEPPKPQPRKLAMAQTPHQMIAADETAVHGVRMHVLVPSTPSDLAAHLRNSGGCMVVSRLSGDGAEVMSVLSLHGGSATLESGAPCDGVPRLMRGAAMNAALGDPLGQARAQHPEESGELVLQVLLTPRLHQEAQLALRQRFGAVSEEEMGQKAAEQGYELTCFAEPGGSVRCQ